MIARIALGFAVFAGISRLLLPMTLSRVQITAFLVAAMAVELVAKPLAGRRPSLVSFAANAAAATLAVIMVKWWLEGINSFDAQRILYMLLHPFG